jgi:hypothetical protein
MALVHLTLKKYNEKYVNSRNQDKWFNKGTVYLSGVMTYSFYFRVAILVFQVLLLSSSAEIYAFETNTTGRALSLMISIAIFAACIVFMVYFFAHYVNFNGNPSASSEELYRGLKENKLCRSYELVSLFRKFLLIFCLVFLQEVTSEGVLVLMSVIQIVFVIGLCYLRPYKELQSNIIEIVNEIIFAILIIMFCSNSDIDKWSDDVATLMFYILVINTAIIVATVVGFLALRILKVCNQKKKSTVVGIQPAEKVQVAPARDLSKYEVPQGEDDEAEDMFKLNGKKPVNPDQPANKNILPDIGNRNNGSIYQYEDRDALVGANGML